MRVCPTCGAQTTERLCPEDGTPTLDEAAFDTDPLLGRVFDDRYEILERLGQGGMGCVYRARQIAMDRVIAVKVLNPEFSRDREAAKDSGGGSALRGALGSAPCQAGLLARPRNFDDFREGFPVELRGQQAAQGFFSIRLLFHAIDEPAEQRQESLGVCGLDQ